jgi:predicted nucleic acid-binding protein
MYVIDASVAVKWFLDEDRHEAAKEFLAGLDPLLAPRLIEVEVVSALSRRVRAGEVPKSHGAKLIERWLADFLTADLLQLVEDRTLLSEAAQLAVTLDHKLPDCLYLALARHAQCPLVTADGPLARKAKGLKGVEVMLLGAKGGAV